MDIDVNKILNNRNSKIIDELNSRMEHLERIGEQDGLEVLEDFYNWYIEEFIY